MKKFLLIAIIIGLAIGGWFVLGPKNESEDNRGERKVLFYQSAMHPWIKSDKPGKCTICGMELTPVYEGEQGMSTDPSLVTLTTNSVNVINVATEEAKVQPLTRTLRVAGVIEENQTEHRFISAYTDARVEKLMINYLGAEVKKGEPLAELYSPQLAATQREYLVLLNRQGTPETLLKGAAYRLERLGLTPEQIKSLATTTNIQSNVEIVAPASGTVVDRFVYEGQYVKQGDKLFELADFSTMWFRFDAYEQDLAWLKAGQQVEVTTPANPGKIYKGEIAFIEPNIQDASRSARVRVELENPLIEKNGRARRELSNRAYAEAVVTIETPQVLTVPRSAVLSPGSKPVVYVQKEDGVYERREVKLGRAGDTDWELLGGVEAGEKVVTRGNLLIDSQAQLNQSVSPAASEPVPGMDLPEFTQQKVEALRGFFEAAAEISKELAADDLDGFNGVVEQANTAIIKLHEATAGHPIEGEAHVLFENPLKKAATLEGARAQFYPFTKLAVSLAEKARSNDERFKDVRVFKCPMAPSPGKTSFWIQLGLPLRNPFYGAEMLECGSEVKAP